MVMFSHVFSAHRGLMWLVSPHNHHNKVSEKVTTILCVQTPRNNTVASLSILREQGTPTPLPGPGYQQSQEWGPRRSWDRRSSERARVETVVAPVTPVAAVSVAPEPPEAADISRSRSRRDVEEDPSWLRLSERWSLQRVRSQWECQCRSCHTCWCRSWTEYLVSTLAREPQSGSGSSLSLWPLTQLPRPGPGIIIISGNEQMGARIYSTRREICKTKDAIKISPDGGLT